MDLLIDSHKLHLHPGPVGRWLENGVEWPLFVEISPSGKCQHRCTFCSFSYTGYGGAFLAPHVTIQAINDMAKGGTKAVMFAGEGEPLLNARLDEMVYAVKEARMDASVTTNGTLLTRKFADRLVPFLSWLRFSINAGYADIYATLHGVSPKEFPLALKAVELAVDAAKGTKCIVGVQSVLLPENQASLLSLALKLRELGAHYYTVKPFVPHPLASKHAALNYQHVAAFSEQLKDLQTAQFQIIWRDNNFLRNDQERPYEQCYGHAFRTYLAASGDIYLCSNFLGDQEWSFGNINELPFADIWQGQRRREVVKRLNSQGLNSCRKNCPMAAMNRYLWRLKNPERHDNFI